MKLKVEIDGDLSEIMNDHRRKMGLAATLGTRFAAEDVKLAWRDQIISAGLGHGVANAVRSEHYPDKGFSYSPASKVYSKTPKILRGFDEGTLVMAANGLWLAIPTEAAGRARTPEMWQRSRRGKLRFVPAQNGLHALLVLDNATKDRKGRFVKYRARKKDTTPPPENTVVIFTLVRQAKLPKRLSLDEATRQAASRWPVNIVNSWRD